MAKKYLASGCCLFLFSFLYGARDLTGEYQRAINIINQSIQRLQIKYELQTSDTAKRGVEKMIAYLELEKEQLEEDVANAYR